jgi:hypothetical protein
MRRIAKGRQRPVKILFHLFILLSYLIKIVWVKNTILIFIRHGSTKHQDTTAAYMETLSAHYRFSIVSESRNSKWCDAPSASWLVIWEPRYVHIHQSSRKFM